MNGPENISKYLRVPIPDQPVLGLLRMSPPKAKELNLNPGQIVRGIVSDDGKSVEFLLGNVKQEIVSNLDKWKGKAIEFKVNIDNTGFLPAERAGIMGSGISSSYNTLDHARLYPLHPKSLLTLLSNPNFSRLNFLNKIQFNSLIDWIKNFYPSSSTGILSSLFYSAKKIDALLIKKQIRNNGYKYISNASSKSGNPDVLTIKSAISLLLKTLEERPNMENNNFKAADIAAFIDYLDANAIEYILKQDQNEVGIRFILLFADFPAVEVYIEGENINPKINGAYKWSIEIKLSFSESNNIWGRIQLISERTVTADILISNVQTVDLANANIKYLYELFRSAGIELVQCNISEGKHLEKDRKEILKERGNLELSA